MFDRMLELHPQLLLTSDLRGRSDSDRERVGRAVVARMQADQPLLQRSALDALSYAGLDDDLRGMLETGQPQWRRRDAVLVASAIGTRALDETLLAIVEDARGRAGYDDQVQLAVYATHVLEGTNADEVVARMTGHLADAETPVDVRAALVSSLFPKHLGAEALVQLVPVTDRFAAPMAPRLAHTVRAALSNERVTAVSLVPWFAGLPGLGRNFFLDASVRELVQGATVAALAAVDVGSAGWSACVDLARWLLFDPSGLGSAAALVGERFSDERRRDLCRDVLIGVADEELVDRLAMTPLLAPDDLLWWLARLADGLDSDDAARSGGLPPSAAHVVAALAWEVVDDDGKVTAARDFCGLRPSLTATAKQAFSEEAVEQRRVLRRTSVGRRRLQEAEQARYRFDQGRLDAAIAAGDFPAVLEEVRREPGKDRRTPGPNGPAAAWSTASADSRRRVVDMAADLLVSGDADLTDFDAVHEVAEALAIVGSVPASEGGPARWFAAVPPERWNVWLPAVMGSAVGLAAPICLRHGLEHDPDGIEATLTEVLTGSASDVAL